MEETYRKKFYYNIEKISEYVEFVDFMENFEEFEFEKVLEKYLLLYKLANKEINEDSNIINKCMEKANHALDCSDIFFNGLIMFGLKFIKPEEIIKMVERIDKIDYVNNTHLVK